MTLDLALLNEHFAFEVVGVEIWPGLDDGQVRTLDDAPGPGLGGIGISLRPSQVAASYLPAPLLNVLFCQGSSAVYHDSSIGECGLRGGGQQFDLV